MFFFFTLTVSQTTICWRTSNSSTSSRSASMDAYFLSKTWLVTMKSAVGLFTATARNLRKSAARRLYTPRKNRKQKSNSRTREFTRSHWTFFCMSTEGPGISPTPNFSVRLVEPSDHEWFRRATKNHPEGKTKTDEERDWAWIESLFKFVGFAVV